MERFEQDYRRGRSLYGLPAIEAIGYARNLGTLQAAQVEGIGWQYEPDCEAGFDGVPELWVAAYDIDTDEILALLVGVEMAYEVSDHGNTHADETDPYLVEVAAQMVMEALLERKGLAA